MKYSHLFLKNRLGVVDYVYTIRNSSKKEKKEEEEVVFIKDYSYQKDKLRKNLDIFKKERVERKTRRTLKLPFHLEYIEIRFFNQFNKDIGSKTDYYQREFGLRPVSYTDFNKTVLFYIENERLFTQFVNLVEQFINSPEAEDPSNKNYHIITFIHSFEFLSSRKIIKTKSERIIVSLTDKLRDNRDWKASKEKFLAHVEKRGGIYSEISEGVLEISKANDFIEEIADNFDVIQKIQSIPLVRVTPGAFGTPRFEWDFETVPNKNLPIIGIIDSGIEDNVTPLRPLILGQTSIFG